MLPGALVPAEAIRIGDHFCIKWQAAKGGAVANDHQLFSGPGHGYVHAADIGQKPNDTFAIAPG